LSPNAFSTNTLAQSDVSPVGCFVVLRQAGQAIIGHPLLFLQPPCERLDCPQVGIAGPQAGSRVPQRPDGTKDRRSAQVADLLGVAILDVLTFAPGGRRGRRIQPCKTRPLGRSGFRLRSPGHVAHCRSWRSFTSHITARDSQQSRSPRGSAAIRAACRSSPRYHLPFDSTSLGLEA